MSDKDMSQVYTVQSQRLDRIEEKLDNLADAVIALARAEEKIHTLTSFSKQQSEQIQKQSFLGYCGWIYICHYVGLYRK